MVIVLLLGLFLRGSVVYGNAAAKQAVSKLEARYRSAQVLQATFLERYSENGHTVRVEAGTAYFRRPGKMRWEYESPEKSLFLVDGKMTWFYVPADHTVTRIPAKQSTDWRTPLALLAGDMKLSRICSSVALATSQNPEQPGDTLLFCALRGEPESVSSSNAVQQGPSEDRQNGKKYGIFLELAPETGDLVRVLVQDKGGITVEFKFANWRFDPPVPDSFFRFEVPRGVAIVNGELLPQGESIP